MSTLGAEKAAQALALVPEGDVWIFITREGSDPGARLVFDAAVSGEAAFILSPSHGTLALVANYDVGHVERLGVFDEIRPYDRSFSEAFQGWIRNLAPRTAYLNYSIDDVLCDGIRHGQFLRTAARIEAAQPGCRIASSEPMLRQVRSVKTAEEIRRIAKAVDGSVALYEQIRPRIEAGQTEREVQAMMRDMASELGYGMHLGDYGGALVCINRVGLAHRAPGDDVLEAGDLLILDHALEYEGYHSDLARTLYVGHPGETEPPREARRAFRSAFQAIDAAFAVLQPGVRGWQVDAAARELHLANGFPEISHATGHQIGREVHDGGTILGPRWERYGTAPEGIVEEGNVFTIEPTILASPEPSMLVEENVVVTADGARWLSTRQRTLWMAGAAHESQEVPSSGIQ